jgi:hypothetical protein
MLISQENMNNSEFMDFFIYELKSQHKNKLMHNAVESVLKFVEQFTGGHIYPFLKLCEHFITNVELSELNYEYLQKFVTSKTFYESELYKSIFNRCFNIGDIANLAVSVYGNEDYIYPEFISYLREFGLWDDQSNFLISDLFETIILNNYLIKNNQDPPILNSDLKQLKRINVINT